MGLMDWMKEQMLKKERIDKKELDIFKITDSPEKVVSMIKEFYRK